MVDDFSILCTCGALRGSVRGLSDDDGPRLLCYCDDCQAFAHFLDRTDDILDAHGGTDVFQMSPARLRIDEGADHLACMRLKPKGLLRWYTSCCQTPIGATLATRHMPFIGLNHVCIDGDCENGSLDQLLGPAQGGVFGRFARGDLQASSAHDGAPMSMILKNIGKILRRRFRGDQKRSPLFDARTGDPIATPKVLNAAERRDLERRGQT